MSIAFRYAARSNVGKVRKNNQDSGYAGPNLLVLADGMGGPAGGDLASVIAVDHLRQIDQQDTTTWTIQQGQQVLAKQVSEAHTEMHYLSQQDPALAGFGTTCIGLVRCQNDSLAISHIGDSRAYLLRGGELKQVTKDHSFVQFLYETGQIKKEEMATHPNRSVLLRVLGDAVEHDTPDLLQELAFPGDRWLLCSDGLCGYVPLPVIYEIIKDTATEPGIIADRLIDAALAVGAPDNVTVVVADMMESSEDLDTVAQVVGSAQLGSQRLEDLRSQIYGQLNNENDEQEVDLDTTQRIIAYSSKRGEADWDYEETTQHFVVKNAAAAPEVNSDQGTLSAGFSEMSGTEATNTIVAGDADDETTRAIATQDVPSAGGTAMTEGTAKLEPHPDENSAGTPLTAYHSQVDEDFTQAVAIPNTSSFEGTSSGEPTLAMAGAEDAFPSLSVPPADPHDDQPKSRKSAWYRTRVFRRVIVAVLILALLGVGSYFAYPYLMGSSDSSTTETNPTQNPQSEQENNQSTNQGQQPEQENNQSTNQGQQPNPDTKPSGTSDQGKQNNQNNK